MANLVQAIRNFGTCPKVVVIGGTGISVGLVRKKKIKVHRLGHIERCLLLVACLVVLLAVSARAQQGKATLAISLQVQPSISLIFQNNPNVGTSGYCPLTNSGTNNVQLNLGTAWLFSSSSSCAAFGWVNPLGTYQISSAFDVVVSKSNSSSASYQMAAKISAAPPANVSWLVNNTALNNTGYTTLDTADSYGQTVTKTLQVQVYFTVPAQGLTETITFLATAN
jgi:hypothetical protein